jgi:EmrB/QacA subfamily drug resistance transporter
VAATAARPADRTGARALLIASAATFLAYLDVTVVNVAFPDLQRDFAGTSLTTLSWNVTAYAVAFAALLAPLGRIADIRGRRSVFVGGMVLFAAASALAAAAPSVGLLIAARLIQGVGAGAMIPAALGIVLSTAAPEKRAQAVGIWGAAGSLAAAAGPTIGGLLVDGFGWRAVFLANLPIAALAIFAALRWLPALAPRPERRPDVAGAVLFVTALGVLVVGLTQAGPWGWTDPGTLALLTGGAVLAAIALARAARHAAPAVEVGLFAHRRFAYAAAGSLLAGAGLFTWLLFGVLYLTEVWHYDILTTGFALSPGALASVAASLAAGRFAQQGKAGQVIVAGALITGITGIAFALLVPEDPAYLAVWLPAGLISGTGWGLLMTGVVAAGASALPPERFAAGTGLSLTARQVGGAIGIAIGASILSSAAHPVDGLTTVFALCGAFALLAVVAGALIVKETAHAR